MEVFIVEVRLYFVLLIIKNRALWNPFQDPAQAGLALWNPFQDPAQAGLLFYRRGKYPRHKSWTTFARKTSTWKQSCSRGYETSKTD
ncbi:hypothetical protein E1A91_A02G187800v1 [Gossypium mustelinum]|uniref:Uncharacterized protein n=1 Tax=Gossypium mustelinum TaxID=34275 RepID=A0A5D3A6W5_GOSMU|nr:hypothetical protein E1A91_A02G187800v1 [Gossypium mustelinum]